MCHTSGLCIFTRTFARRLSSYAVMQKSNYSCSVAAAALAAASAAAASLAARRAARSALHMRRCPPSRQSACEQAVLQYHTAWQAL